MMDLLIVIAITSVIWGLVASKLIRRSYALGAVDFMETYKGIVNIKVCKNKDGSCLYYDMATDAFIIQMSDQEEAKRYISKVFKSAKMIVFSSEDIVNDAI